MTDTAYGWLPERHLGVAATLAHADELIGQVSDLLFVYQTQCGDVVQLSEVRAGSVSKTTVVGVTPIPRKVALLTADALVALRAALEHTLFAEVEYLDGSPLEERAARLVEMPAAHTLENFQKWTAKSPAHRPPSLRAGSELVRRIDGLQPYHRRRDPQDHPLALLASHTNHAKHRTPAVTAVRIAAMYHDDQVPQGLSDLAPRPEGPLRVGDVLAETPIGTQSGVTLFPMIGVNRPGTAEWPVLMNELGHIADWVRTQAVPRLVTGAEPSQPPLPARYDISVGHPDERHALVGGLMLPAAERHRQRLSAAADRANLSDLIGDMPGAPDRQHVTAWLDHLTDEQVLERGFTPNPTNDPHINRSNLDLLQRLIDEASRFRPDEQQ
ncbi:hypothetical protein [Longispora urticae]